MGLILALDTTSELGGVALYDGGRDALSETPIHSPEGFGHILFDRIAQLLDREGVGVEQIDCFAAASGPGSFTGVRLGLTAAKGLAEAASRPVVAVSNLRVLASLGTSDLRATVLDARRGEVFGAVYDAGLTEVQKERVLTFTAWLAGLPAGVSEFIGTNMAVFSNALDAGGFGGVRVIEVRGTLAGAVARIAHHDFVQGRAVDPVAVDANYVRRSDAELLWTDR